MKKRLIAIGIGVSMLIPQTAFTANAEEADNVTSVSGYVSTTSGIKLAGEGKTPSIYVDDNDYDGVIRASGDLCEDIYDVTGVTPTIIGADTEAVIAALSAGVDEAYIKSVDIEAGKMVIGNGNELTGTGRGIIGIYDAESGKMKRTVMTEDTANSQNAVLNFDAFELQSDESCRAFLWEENNNILTMRPLTKVFTGAVTKPDVEIDVNADVIIGTIGHSDVIDNLITSGALDVSEIEGKWECFTVQSIDNKTIIAGSDKRGTIFGIYDLSEKMGVSPWKWWADVKPTHEDNLYINLPYEGYTEGEPSVKYRGIFINDEYNLNQWSASMGNGDSMNEEVYKKVFELLLRLKANYLWPAMHPYSTAFNLTENNAKNADIYGIVMGSSHCEMMLRNNLGEFLDFQDEWEKANPDKTLYKRTLTTDGLGVPEAYDYTDHDASGNAVYNKELLKDYWRARIKENGAYENTYTLGMRGIHDEAWNPSAASSNDEKIKLLTEIIDVQREILKEEIGGNIEDIPQVLVPYKEIQTVYNAGLTVPDDVTLMWTDDNFGYVRQNANDAERQRSGGTGIYYHVSYYGKPISNLWLTSTQLGLMREEMTKSYDMGADRIWILNVGDIKPAETEMEYFLKLAKNVDEMRGKDIEDYLAETAKRDFGFNDADAREYAEIKNEYYELANARRPEFMRSNYFSLTSFGDEAQKYLDKYDSLVERCEALYEKTDKKEAFFELELYPLRSCRNITADYIYADKANLYSEQGRGASSNAYAALSKSAADEIAADTAEYNSMLDGKWNKIMNLKPAWMTSCAAQIETSIAAATVSELEYTGLGVAVDGQADIASESVLSLSKYDTENKFIDIFNTGYGEFEWSVSSDADYITFNKTSGTVSGDDRIYTGVDYSKAPAGISSAKITVNRYIENTVAETKEISVTISNPDTELNEKTYVETNGIVSIEAEHYTNSVANGSYEWKVEKDFGRSGDTVKIYPNLASSVTAGKDKSAYLEYNVYFENTGTYTLDVYRMPTINERGSMKFGIGIDDGNPVILTGHNAYVNNSGGTDAWGKGVLENNQTLSTSVNINTAGYHTIRLYNQDCGIVIDKMVLTKGDKQASYFGAPESYNTTYNNTAPVMPQPSEAKQVSGNIKKLYEPDVQTAAVNQEGLNVTGIDIVKLTNNADSAVVALAAYDSNGNTTKVQYAALDLTSYTANQKITVPLEMTLEESDIAKSVIVFDSFDTMNIIAPEYTEGNIVTEGTGDTIKVKSDIAEYKGSRSMIIVYDGDMSAANIKYMAQEKITSDTYRYIPFDLASQGKYKIRIGINGVGVFDEEVNTIVNIHPDTEGSTEEINRWSFTDSLKADTGNDMFTVSGGASLDSTNGKIKMNTTSTGSAGVSVSNPVAVMQGQQVTVDFDIYYGKLTKQYMDYSIKNSDGVALVSTHISAYDPGANAPTVTIGSENKVEDIAVLTKALARSSNTALSNGATHFCNVFDFETGKATVTISSSGGSVTYSGRMTEDAKADISSVNFSTTYTNDERACYVDNVAIGKTTNPQYKILFVPTSGGENVSNAEITVTDKKCGVEITPETDGSYLLCDGDYIVKATADGYIDYERTIEVSPALESKTVSLEMNSAASLQEASAKISFKDENGNEILNAVTVNGVYSTRPYSVDTAYLTTQKISNNGKLKVYEYDEGSSMISTSSLAAGENEFTVTYSYIGEFYVYEDFGDYTVSSDKWTSNTSVYPTIISESGNKYLKFTAGSSTVGAYTALDTIEGNNGKFKISADLKFAPTGTAGNSQFTIGNSSPAFMNNNTNNGIVDGNESAKDKRAAGHIIALEYITGSKFNVNGETVSTDFINSWMHIEATVDFSNKTVVITLTNDNGSKETVNSEFYSDLASNNTIGSMYIRGARNNGTVSVDNLTIADYADTPTI